MVLRIGQKVPDFSLPDTDKKLRSLGEFVRRGPLVIAFFPLAFSGTCDKEMCAFRDELVDFQDVGAQLVGISVDSAFTLRAFAQTYNLGFPLLSDFNKKVTKLFGVIHDPWVDLGYKGVAKRSVFLVDRKGVLRYRWSTEAPSDEPPYHDIIRAVRKLSE